MHGTVTLAGKPLAKHTASSSQQLHPEEYRAAHETVLCYSKSGHQGDNGWGLTWRKLSSPRMYAEIVTELAVPLPQVELAWGCSQS